MNEETNRARSGRIFRSRTARPLWSGLARAGGLSWPKLLTILIAAVIWVASLTAPDAVRAAPLAGAIFTTTPNGAIVNENVRYNQKIEVYLDGGPGPNAPQQAAGLPDGDYAFQVTDPSGDVLLSEDISRCRVFRVQNGIIVALRDKPNGSFVDHTSSDACHVNDSPDGVAGATGKHDTNTDADHGGQGAIVVQLMPFFDTPNPGGVYKAWAMPLSRYLANGGNLDATPTPKCTRHGSPSNCTGNAVQIGFVRDDAFGPPRDQVKTDNFKVQEFVRPLLHVRKFNDLNRNGTWQQGTEPEIGVDQCVDVSGQIVDCTVGGGWPVWITEPLTGGPVTNHYFTPVTVLAETSGVWTVLEETFASKGWQQTAVFVDGVSQGVTNPVNVTVLGNSGEEHEVIFGDAQKPETPRVNTEIHLGSGTGEGANPTVVSGPVQLGSKVHDKATVKPTTKNGTPTGSVTFTFYTGGDCSTGTPVVDIPADTKPLVAGGAHPSKDRGPLGAGSYAFKAHFTSGDPARWTDADSDCEPFTVKQRDLTLVTTVHKDSPDAPLVGDASLGDSLHDSAQVTGIVPGFPLTNSVTFTWYSGLAGTANEDCTTGTSHAAGSHSIDATGLAHPSGSTGALGAGNYAFRANLVGNSNYTVNGSKTNGKSDCEPFKVRPRKLTLSTEIHLGRASDEGASPTVVSGSIPGGSTVHDQATVTGILAGVPPANPVTFTFYTGGDCTNGISHAAGSAPIVGTAPGVAHPSDDEGPLAPGTYAFVASLVGDSNYVVNSNSPCEPLIIQAPETPPVNTEIHFGPGSGEGKPTVVQGSIPPGSTVHDKATVKPTTKSGTPVGSVTFTFYTGGDCTTGTPVVDIPADTLILVGGVAHPSKDRGPLAAGSYAFKAHFTSGDPTKWTDADSPCEPFTVGNPGIVKSPRLANLWLCNQPSVTACANPSAGIGERDLNVNLTGPVISLEPKCIGFPNFQDPATCPAQTIGSFQFEVRFDSKFVTVTVEPGALFNRSDASCASIFGQNFVQFRCNIKGKPADAPRGPGTLAVVKVKPTPPDYAILVPSQGNSIVTQLINQDCQISDPQGHPVKLAGQAVPGIGPGLCEAAAISIRYLEGDVHPDCVVDVQDQQQIAFRWGGQLGSPLYNSWYDLEPGQPAVGDDDIDLNDLQMVYGRHGSTCADPHPPQLPINPKAKVG